MLRRIVRNTASPNKHENTDQHLTENYRLFNTIEFFDLTSMRVDVGRDGHLQTETSFVADHRR